MFTNSFAGSRKGFDTGLRQYMLKIYNLMAAALVLSGAMAYAFATIPALTSLIFVVNPNGSLGYSALGYIAAFAPIGIAFYFFWGNASMTIQRAQSLFWIYAALTGVSLASLGFIYTGASIAKTFFITASMFGGMSIYGYTTNKDLTSMGSLLFVGLITIILASIVNIFMQSPAVEFAVSILGIIIFLGLTAYDTQRLKEIYYSAGGGEYAQKMAIVGAFILYLDFINLFIYLLRFLGVRKE